MTAVGLAGLGVLGSAVGRRLIATGATVTAVDISERSRAAWEAATGRPALASVAEAPRQEAWFVLVRTSGQAAAVVGELAAAGETAPVYVLTTLGPADAETLAATAGAAVRVVAVSGGEPAALRGQLVAAVPDGLAPADRRFLLATVAGLLVDVGGPRQVALAKVLVNAMIGYQFSALDRLVGAAEEGGLAPAALFDLLYRSSAGSAALGAVLEYDAGLLDADDAVSATLGPVGPAGAAAALDAVRRVLRSVAAKPPRSIYSSQQGGLSEPSEADMPSSKGEGH